MKMMQRIMKLFSQDQKLKPRVQPEVPQGALEGPFLVFTLLVLITGAAIPAVIYPFYVAGSTKPREPWGMIQYPSRGKGGGSMWGNIGQTQQSEAQDSFNRVLDQKDDDDED
eukprot:TRINITY_DN23067_c0_g1_i1.p3 TRINITY_DN23067_c0_g1~~TRINITY_DN23067_c0_g1_i1.p3  ORF type:complete len:112 (-),score=16.49 TRINITY_DN23067_c0_g1_i1:367-702(-)